MVTPDEIIYFKNSRAMLPYLIHVETNVYDIPERLREIDKGYFVMFNPKSQQYEVHHREQITGTLCLNLPYSELDTRAIEFVQKTRIENIKKVIAEMERNNELLEIDATKRRHEYIEQSAKDLHTYCSRHEDKEKLDPGAYKTRFV